MTVLAAPLRPEAIAGIAGRIAACGANIDRIVRPASYPVTCLELEVSRPIPTCCASSSPPKPSPLGGRRRPALGPVSPRQAPHRDGRRLDADPGRGHRVARHPRGLRERGGPGHRGGDARPARLRRVAAGPGCAPGRVGRGRPRRGTPSGAVAPARAPWSGPSSDWMPLRDRQRRIPPGDRRACGRSRDRLCCRQHPRSR